MSQQSDLQLAVALWYALPEVRPLLHASGVHVVNPLSGQCIYCEWRPDYGYPTHG